MTFFSSSDASPALLSFPFLMRWMTMQNTTPATGHREESASRLQTRLLPPPRPRAYRRITERRRGCRRWPPAPCRHGSRAPCNSSPALCSCKLSLGWRGKKSGHVLTSFNINHTSLGLFFCWVFFCTVRGIAEMLNWLATIIYTVRHLKAWV